MDEQVNARNRAVVNVGVTHETAEFAVESIRRWWRMDGRRHYREAQRLLICADSGGGNGSRQWARKVHLQQLSDETGMAITVCHFPPMQLAICRAEGEKLKSNFLAQ